MGKKHRPRKAESESPGQSAGDVRLAAPAVADGVVPARTAALDIATLDPAEFPHRDWPAGIARDAGFQALITRSALNDVHRHGRSTRDVEVCGVLVGGVYRDAAGPFLVVDATVPGNAAVGRNAQVTFTAQTWEQIQAVMDRDHPDRKIVGWYHTHPGFGIFLSDMDLFIHGHFFNLPWQVALVFDPKSGEEGLFAWREGKAEKESFAIEEDVERSAEAAPTMTPEAMVGVLGRVADRLAALERRQKGTMVALAFMFLVVMGWPFVLFTVMSSDRGGRPLPIARADAPAAAPRAAPAPATGAAVAIVAPATAPAVAAGHAAAAVPAATTPARGAADARAEAPPPAPQPPAHPELIRPGSPQRPGGAKVIEVPDR